MSHPISSLGHTGLPSNFSLWDKTLTFYHPLNTRCVKTVPFPYVSSYFFIGPYRPSIKFQFMGQNINFLPSTVEVPVANIQMNLQKQDQQEH